jgi:protein DGCR14
MSSQNGQSLIRRSTDTELMPPPPTKRIKRPPKVLDEDTYTDALSEIIARDFFPGLLETRTQQEYLDALDSQDGEWIASAGRKLTEVMTPGIRRRGRRGVSMMTPGGLDMPRGYGGDTPASAVSDESSASTSMKGDKPKVDTNLSLDNFQSKYTSEDNESFNKLLDKQNEKRAQRYSWVWAGNRIPGYRLLKQKEREEKMLKARADQESENGGRRQLAIGGSDERKAMPDTWKSKPDNEFMFAPDGVEDTFETVQQRAEAQSRAPPKAVVYENTRLPPAPVENPTVPPSPSLTTVRDAIAGRPRPTASEPGFTGGETPRVNGYSFVDDAPSPSPSELGAPPLTWGTLEGSHHLLGSGDTTPNPFTIKEASKRETLHHKMVDRVAKNNRAAAKYGVTGKAGADTPAGTPTPKFASSPRVGGNLTPAAQRLWSRVGSSGGSKLGGTFGGGRATMAGKARESSLRHRWTPTPRVQHSDRE